MAVLAAGCAPALKTTTPPAVQAGMQSAVSVSANMPEKKYLPNQAGYIEGTRYIFMQTGGGSILLGPIFGSMNVSRLSQEMAKQYKDSVIQVDPLPASTAALEAAGIKASGEAAAFNLKPFVFVQRCDDERFRLALVFHVDNANTKWTGRYTYHLQSVYPEKELAQLSAGQLDQYKKELTTAATALAGLVKRDLKGDLPATGKRVNLGSLHLLGSKMGGLGMYTKPEDMYFANSQILEETDEYVIARVPGMMESNVFGGAIAYGVQRLAKNQIHTMKPY